MSLLNSLGSLARRAVLGTAGRVVTSPAVRWTWTGLSDDKFAGALVDIRPADRFTVREMMAGRYLLASRVVDTDGQSPFAVAPGNAAWEEQLQNFSWLRHFRDAHDPGERGFARMLVLDWIGRFGQYDPEHWSPALCAQRVMNWLRHHDILAEGASPEQLQRIDRVLGTQIQSLKVRGGLVTRPLDRILPAAALLGVALCDEHELRDAGKRLVALLKVMAQQFDDDGMHLSRSPAVQLEILAELLSLRLSLTRVDEGLAMTLEEATAPLHLALRDLTLGSGEPAYFNGTGQLPHDLLVAVQSHAPARIRASTTVGGYGVLVDHAATVVLDSGLVPPAEFAEEAHAGALGFEFSYGTELVVGSCGPAPIELADRNLLFRQSVAHSAPTIDGESSATIGARGVLAAAGPPPVLTLDPAEASLLAVTHGYGPRYGVGIERRLSLLAEGRTLVGQDRIGAADRRGGETLILRFHLAPGARVERSGGEALVRIRLGSGQVWTFLWEGAGLDIEETVRQSAYFGFQRSEQLVLTAPLADGAEVAWIFTLESD